MAVKSMGRAFGREKNKEDVADDIAKNGGVHPYTKGLILIFRLAGRTCVPDPAVENASDYKQNPVEGEVAELEWLDNPGAVPASEPEIRGEREYSSFGAENERILPVSNEGKRQASDLFKGEHEKQRRIPIVGEAAPAIEA